MNEVYQSLEDVISQVFIPTLTGCPPLSESLRLLFALPARWGRGGWVLIFVPTSGCASEFAASYHLSESLCCCIHDHSLSFADAVSSQLCRKASLRSTKYRSYSDLRFELQQQLKPSLQCAVELATVRGASNWFTTLPLNEHA